MPNNKESKIKSFKDLDHQPPSNPTKNRPSLTTRSMATSKKKSTTRQEEVLSLVPNSSQKEYEMSEQIIQLLQKKHQKKIQQSYQRIQAQIELEWKEIQTQMQHTFQTHVMELNQAKEGLKQQIDTMEKESIQSLIQFEGHIHALEPPLKDIENKFSDYVQHQEEDYNRVIQHFEWLERQIHQDQKQLQTTMEEFEHNKSIEFSHLLHQMKMPSDELFSWL